MKTIKTEYKKPTINIYKMVSTCNILAGSGIGDGQYHDRDEEDDEI